MVTSMGDTLNKWVAPLMFVAFGVLLLHHFGSSWLFTSTEESSTQLSLNTVRGSALVVKHVPYTLNFAQQTSVIQALDRTIAVSKDSLGAPGERPFFEQLIVYRFNQPELIIRPLEQRETTLVLDIPEWSKTHYFLDTSSGELAKTLQGAFGL